HLALRVEEVDSARRLVALQPRDNPHARVERLDERTIGVVDLLAELLDQRVVGHGRPNHFKCTGLWLGSASSRKGYVTPALTGSPSVGVRSRTTTWTWSPCSYTLTTRRA